MPENGVKLALAAAREFSRGGKSPYIMIAELLSSKGEQIGETAIYNCEKKGFFPLTRAQVIAEEYGIEIDKLVSPAVRAALEAGRLGTINS